MKILAIADEEARYLWDYFEKSKLKGVDLIISCGDLAPEYLSFLATFTSAPVLYVHGNHDDKYEVIIITALDSELTDYRDKWFEEQFPNDKFNIIYTHNKDEVDIDYLIDDGLHNLDNLSKKIGNDRCICIDEPYNKSDKYPRFKSLKGAIDYIRGREG